MGKKGTGAAADAASAVRAATIALTRWQQFTLRQRLHYACWRETPFDSSNWKAAEEYLNNNAGWQGKRLKRHLGDSLSHALHHLTGGAAEPFVVVPGIFAPRFAARSLIRVLDPDRDDPMCRRVGDRASALIYRRHYNMVAAALIAATDNELRKKAEDDTSVYYDFVTTVGAEKTPFTLDPDMYLRFRSVNAAGNLTSHVDRSARVVVYACIENHIADPIYLIRAEDIVAELDARQRQLLSEPGYRFFEYWDAENLEHVRAKEAKNILHQTPAGDWWLSFDPQSFDADRQRTSNEQLAAVAALMGAIRKTGLTRARKIVLRRGDALIVDNYRALTRRREYGHRYFNLRPLGRMPLRWLRVYRGYPKS